MTTDILIACIGVFFGEIYGNFVGGGSLVTQTVLQNILHFSIKEAMALDNAAVIGSNLGMLIMLIRKYQLKWWMIPFIVFQIAGAFLGVQILVWIPESLLQGIFIIALLALVIKNLFFPDNGHTKEKGFIENRKNILFLCITAIFIGAYNASFVIGDWIVALMILTTVFHFKYQDAIFLLVVSMTISQPFATLGYIQHGLVNLDFLFPMIASTFASGLIAGYLVHRIHSDILNGILKYVSVFLVLYLVYGLFW